LVQHLQHAWDVGLSRVCRVISINRSVYRYQSKRYDQAPLRARIKEIAYTRARYGFKRIHILLRREGWLGNHKRVYRLYCLEQLNLRYRKPRRHKSSSARINRLPAQQINQCWSMDFVCDQLFNGQRLRFLTVVDIFSRECLAIEVGQRLTGEDVVRVVTAIVLQSGNPKQVFLDNGTEFVSKGLDK